MGALKPEKARELRARLEIERRLEDTVREAAVGVADLDFVRYRRLNLRTVRNEIQADREDLVFAGIHSGIVFTGGYLIARYFGVSAVAGVGLGLFSLALLLALSLVFSRNLPERREKLAIICFNLVVVTATALIVLGEVAARGPVHAVVGHPSDRLFLYLLAHGVLSFATFGAASWMTRRFRALTRRYRRLHRDPEPTAVDTLFRCVELAHDEKAFMDPANRSELVSTTHEVAFLLKHGLWRTMRVQNPLATRELRRRCVHAGQSVELLCVRLVLPTRTTHRDYLNEILKLADTVLSGRYGELPDDPERASYVVRSKLAVAGRFVGQVAAGLTPLAVYLLLRHFTLIPAAAEVPVLTLCVAWLATYGLNALSRSHQSGSSQFPNVLGIFGSTK
ncbi:hypothetical protein [Lentzea sp. NPDC055074]